MMDSILLSGLGFRRFANHDWQAFGGAENFADGSAPWICDPNPTTQIVIGGGGVLEIFTFSEDPDADMTAHMLVTSEPVACAVAVSVLALLRAGETVAAITAFFKFESP